jgi:hypothetical protein
VKPALSSTASRTVKAGASNAVVVLSLDLVQPPELRRFERRCSHTSLSRRAGGVAAGSVSRSTAKVRTNIAANHRQSCELCTLAPGLCIGIMAQQPCSAMHNKSANTDPNLHKAASPQKVVVRLPPRYPSLEPSCAPVARKV